MLCWSMQILLDRPFPFLLFFSFLFSSFPVFLSFFPSPSRCSGGAVAVVQLRVLPASFRDWTVRPDRRARPGPFALSQPYQHEAIHAVFVSTEAVLFIHSFPHSFFMLEQQWWGRTSAALPGLDGMTTGWTTIRPTDRLDWLAGWL